MADHDTLQGRLRAEMGDRRIFEQAKECALAYLEGLTARRVFPDEAALAALDAFDEPLPEAPRPAGELIEQLHRLGSPATVAQGGGRYFGFVNGGVVPAALAARWLADAWDQNAALYVMSPVVARLEQVCERWLVELLGLPAESVAGLVGGTSTATLCGLAAGRYALLERLGWDVNRKGLAGAPSWRVVAGEQAHGTVFKALALLGVGREGIELVPSDDQGRMDPRRLPALDERTLLVLQAGNVNTGAFDDFEQLAGRAAEVGAWVHVDGAFGLWAAASEGRRRLTRGVAVADSWSVDGHKTLNTPYDLGIVLCRHRQALAAAMQATGDYIQYGGQREGMLFVPEMSRRARAVELWATLKSLGRRGVGQLVDGLCERAAQFAAGLPAQGFRVLNEVVFNQVLAAAETPAATEAVLAELQRSGVLWCGATRWAGAPAIRISVCSWATTAEDVARCLSEFGRARRAAAAAG